MQPTLRACASVAVAIAAMACGRKARNSPEPGGPPLALFAAQRVVLAPVTIVRADTSGLAQGLGGARATGRRLDSLMVVALQDRGAARNWILPADLTRAYERNRTYASDPYQLAVEPLRSPRFVAGERYGEPLSTQLRTMIALHEDARMVLLPVEFRLERAGAAARGVLRATLLDPRLAQATWVGDIRGDPAPTAAVAIANVAARVADLFAAP